MGLLINPDGTTTYVEEEYDAIGAAHPSKSYLLQMAQQNDTPTTTEWNRGKSSQSSRKHKKKQQSDYYPTSSSDRVQTRTGKVIVDYDAKKASVGIAVPTISAIDRYFAKMRKLRKVVPESMLMEAKRKLKPRLFSYFEECYHALIEFCGTGSVKFKKNNGSTMQKPKKAASASKKEKKAVRTTCTVSSGHTIADIAIIKKNKIEADATETRATGFGKGRAPKYGYARDYFGRVQERDRLDEDRRNEFAQRQRQQSRYDYSNYDANDDHDGDYSSWE